MNPGANTSWSRAPLWQTPAAQQGLPPDETASLPRLFHSLSTPHPHPVPSHAHRQPGSAPHSFAAAPTMPLIYSFVARGGGGGEPIVLADYTAYTGNFSVVAIQARAAGTLADRQQPPDLARRPSSAASPGHPGCRRPCKKAPRATTPSSPTLATATVSCGARRARGRCGAAGGLRRAALAQQH